jgi:hypothetical protein
VDVVAFELSLESLMTRVCGRPWKWHSVFWLMYVGHTTNVMMFLWLRRWSFILMQPLSLYIFGHKGLCVYKLCNYHDHLLGHALSEIENDQRSLQIIQLGHV